MSEWSITFSDGKDPSFVILKNVPAGATEAAVRKEISQQPTYKGRPISSAIDTANITSDPGPVTVKPPANKPTVVKPPVKPPVKLPSDKPPVFQPDDAGEQEGAVELKKQKAKEEAAQAEAEKKKADKEAADAKKAAADAEKKARDTKDAKDRQAALDAQQAARIAKEKADQAQKDAKEKKDIIDTFRKNSEEQIKPVPIEDRKPVPATVPTPATVPPPAEVKPTPPSTTTEPPKSNEPEGPKTWDKIKQGAKDIGNTTGLAKVGPQGAQATSTKPGVVSGSGTVQTPTPGAPGQWVNVGFGISQWVGAPGPDPEGNWKGQVFVDGDVMPNAKYSTGVGNAKTSNGKGAGGVDQKDRQQEDFDRILKLAGLNK